MMKKYFLAFLVGTAFIFSPAVALAQSDEEWMQRGEQMMQMMMGSQHEAYEQELERQMGSDFVDQMHEAMGRMGDANLSSDTYGGMPLGMMRMMMGSGSGWGMMGYGSSVGTFIVWIWLTVWTVNSVLVGVLMWVLIKKYSRSK